MLLTPLPWFVGLVPTHQPVHLKSLARWMTNILGLGGVGHPEMAASQCPGCHRKHKGVPNHQLVKLSDWSSVYGTLRNFMTDTTSCVFIPSSL